MIARAAIDSAALRPTRTRYAVLLFVYLAAFITYLDRVWMSVAAPGMQKDLGLSQVQFAWVFTVFYIAYGIFEMPSASYQCSDGFNGTATVYEIKATSLGIEGRYFSSNAGGGCREAAQFSAVLQ